MENGQLHVVRKDVLLWALGGFAEEGDPLRATSFTPQQIGQMAEVASKRRASFHEVADLARKIGHSAGSVRTTITKMRRGPLPRYHEVALRDLGLSVPALDRMDAVRALALRTSALERAVAGLGDD